MKAHSKIGRILHKFMRRRLAVIGSVVVLLLIVCGCFGDTLSPFQADEVNVLDRFQGPSAKHWFGTDDLGRDTMARILMGLKITLVVSFASVLFALIIGTILGLIAGYYGGVADHLISGFMDSLWAFPAIILALAINTALGASLRNIFLAIGIVYTPNFCRLTRSRVLSIREMEYISSARSIGLSDRKIIMRYVLPNLSSTLIVQATLSCAKAVIAESSLSFLGLGVPLPMASLGTILKNGYGFMSRAPWLSIFPGICIMLLVMCLNFMGDGLRDALDVRIRPD